MGPRIDKVEKTSQATPFAGEFLKKLEGGLSGAFGTGVGPQQREAGTAIRQLLSSLQGGGTEKAFGAEGGSLIQALQTGSKRRTAERSADLTELFGAAGVGRFGTAIARGQGQLFGEAEGALSEQIGQILLGQQAGRQQAREFDITQLSQVIAQLFGQGQENIALFERFAALGILPEEIIASPGLLAQALSGGVQLGAAFLGRPPGQDTVETGG